MTTTALPGVAGAGAEPYRHAAVFYAGPADFLDKTVPFIEAGIAAGEPTFVVVSAEKIEALRGRLGGYADGVEFADMSDVGANPARIIPAWQDFVDAHPGKAVRGIGEPISAERSSAALAECQHHERLLNPALEASSLFLVCPYDTDALPADVIAEARRSHPLVHGAGPLQPSADYDAVAAATGLLDEPLPEPEVTPEVLAFEQSTLPELRRLVRHHAELSGLGEDRVADLTLAVGELATNTIRHGGGRGTLRLWREDNSLVCEIEDGGQIDDPLLDRRRPAPGQLGGWGLWIANQACDLLQLRSLGARTVARLHMQLG